MSLGIRKPLYFSLPAAISLREAEAIFHGRFKRENIGTVKHKAYQEHRANVFEVQLDYAQHQSAWTCGVILPDGTMAYGVPPSCFDPKCLYRDCKARGDDDLKAINASVLKAIKRSMTKSVAKTK